MKIFSEKSLENFEFWSGGKDFADKLSHDELVTIESNIEELYPDGIDETQLNDLFWFEQDTLCEWLGYEDYEDWLHKDDDDEQEDD